MPLDIFHHYMIWQLKYNFFVGYLIVSNQHHNYWNNKYNYLNELPLDIDLLKILI